jgi:hypothetical protein
MPAVIEVRTYRIVPGGRDAFVAQLRELAIPAHTNIGMKILGPFLSAEDDQTLVWLRAFPDAASRESMKDAFYDGEVWLEEMESVVMPLIEHFESVLVEDTIGLWDSWPETAGHR